MSNLALPHVGQPHVGNESAPATAEVTAPVLPNVPFKVSGTFSSHMVLQRENPITVHGFSDTPGSRVAGCFMGETATATITEDGRWALTFAPRPYNREPQIMVISDDREHTVTFEDILIGDVWFIGGQSNAEMAMSGCLPLTPSVIFDENDNFRVFRQTQVYAAQPEICAVLHEDVANPEWCWKRPDEAACIDFSAMGWFFANEVSKYIDIPLGLVMMAAGGACLCELWPAEIAHGEGIHQGNLVCVGGYYNTLIHPFERTAFKGMLFFQGESEGCFRERAPKYAHDLALFVADERARFGRQFPFYYVQLSDYTAEAEKFWPWHDIVRIEQFRALSLIPDSAMTVDLDLGTPEGFDDWAHSPRKMELGERLARLILAREYGVGHVGDHSSPRPVLATLNAAGDAVTVEFADVHTGLIVSGHSPADSYGLSVEGFSFGTYERRTPAKATLVTRHSVLVEVPEGLDPADLAQVNYAFFCHITPENANLRGGNNLPVPAFSLPVAGAPAAN